MQLDELKAIVGPKGWSTDAHELEPHLNERRGVYTGRTPIMLSPSSTEEVAAIIRVCARDRIGVVPQGGNTGLCGGAIPDTSGSQILLSMGRMNRIRTIDPDDFSIVAEAGCALVTVQQAARDVGRFFPLSLAAEGSCQIGGNLSTNAGGMHVLRYGTARQLVLGLEVVCADGRIWDGLRSLRKDTAGYDLKQLFIGSEGTLGIITAASLKLYPDPGETVTAMVALSDADAAVQLLADMRGTLADRLQAFELMSDRAMRFVERHIPNAKSPFSSASPWYVLLDAAVEGQHAIVEEALATALEQGHIIDAVLAKSVSEAEQLWQIRHAIPDAQRPEGASLKHDVSVPVGRIGEFLLQGNEILAEAMPDARLVAFGHVGDGNMHYNIAQPRGADPDTFRDAGRALTEAIYDLVAELGGSISAEHGIGVAKKVYLERYRGGAEIELMRALKRALDPENTLNPGKVI